MGGPLSAWGQIEDEEVTEKKSLSKIFDEEPVPLQVFIQDKKYLGEEKIVLSPIQTEAVKHIERIYYPDLYPLMAEEFDDGDYWADPIPVKNLITLQWGKGSGKDAIARWASLRIAYLLLCLKSPQDYFDMPETDSIHLLNIAANSGQANQAFFQPMVEKIKASPWFRDRANPKQNLIEYNKHIKAISGHSDAEGQEGLNIMLGVADEIDAFRSKSEMVGLGKRQREASTSAESILSMLQTSANTRFPTTYKRVTISYPRYLGSTIQKETEKGRESNKKYGEKSIHYVSGPYATWVVNPRISGPEHYQEDYDADPEGAAGKYECKPSRAINSYFKSIEQFQRSISSPVQPVSIEYKLVKQNDEREGWEPIFHFAPDFVPIEGAIYAMHGDMAITGDRAGIAMSHVKTWIERTEIRVDEDGAEVETPVTVPVIQNDFTIAFEADVTAKPAREIQIRWARKLAFELINRGFVVQSFTFDNFQSVDSMQILERHGIESKRVSTDINDEVYKSLKDVVYDSRLYLPFDQILFNELEALSRINGKVDHPPGGSKDKADALACSVIGAINVGGSEDPEGNPVEMGQDSFLVGVTDFAPIGSQEIFNTNGRIDLPIGMRGF